MLENTVKKGVFDQWIALIYDRLEKLNESYIRMHEGCSDLLEYIQTSNQKEVIEQTQYKNAGFILTYVKNILASAKPMFKNEDYESMKSKLNYLEALHETGVKLNDGSIVKVYEIKINEINNTQSFKLTVYFGILVKEISNLYEELIDKLRDILFLEGNIRNK